MRDNPYMARRRCVVIPGFAHYVAHRGNRHRSPRRRGQLPAPPRVDRRTLGQPFPPRPTAETGSERMRVVDFPRIRPNQPGREEDFTLDVLGNWPNYVTKTDGTTQLDHNREHNLANEIADTSGNSDAIETTTGSDWRDPTWDASGNMTDGPLPTAPTCTHVVKYDAWNRLVYADLVQPNYKRKYYYDGLNRMVHSAWYNPTVQKWDVEDHYYNDAWQRLQDYSSWEQNSELTLAQGAGGAHVWSLRYIDALITNGSYYYTNDANFNVTSAVSTNGGDPAHRFGYDPYGQWHSYTVYNFGGGQIVWLDGGQLTSYGRVLYAGYYADWIMKFYHVRNRVYNSALGRWMQRDPIGYADGMHLYEYVQSGPTGNTDPSGSFGLGQAILVLTLGKAACDLLPAALDRAYREAELFRESSDDGYRGRWRFARNVVAQCARRPISRWVSGNDIAIGSRGGHFLAAWDHERDCGGPVEARDAIAESEREYATASDPWRSAISRRFWA